MYWSEVVIIGTVMDLLLASVTDVAYENVRMIVIPFRSVSPEVVRLQCAFYISPLFLPNFILLCWL